MFSRMNSVNPVETFVYNDNYWLSDRGKVIHKQTLESCETEVIDGYDYVIIEDVKYRLIDALALHFKFLKDVLSEEQYDKVEGFKLDKTEGLRVTNIGYRFKDGPLENHKYPGYYIVPDCCHLSISKLGLAINSHTGGVITGVRTKPPRNNVKNIVGGYVRFIVTVRKVAYQASRHRALALTFIPYDNSVDMLQVNHINGIPGDDWLDNLEWVTPRQNNIHAVRMGLRSQNRPVVAYNLHTKEFKSFYSIASCAEEIGYSDMTVGNIVNNLKKTLITKEGWTFKYDDEEFEFLSDEVLKEQLDERNRSMVVRVRNCETGEIEEYPSVTIASRATKINDASIEWRLKRDNYSPLFGFQFVPEGEEFPDFTNEEYKASLVPNSSKVDARNIMTNETKEFDSIRKAVKETGRGGLTETLRNGKQPCFNDGWTYKLRDMTWDVIEDPLQHVRSLTNDTIVVDTITGKETRYPSIRSTAKALGVNKSTLGLNLRKSIRPYKWDRYLIRLNHLF